jgi:Stage II sporulation protein E (SpoIIE)
VSTRLFVRGLLLLLALQAYCQESARNPVQDPTPTSSRALTISGIGEGAKPIDGAWQFHTGDDSRWALPGFDDSSWEEIGTDAPFGAQGHPSYAGFAWYRRHVNIVPTSGSTDEYSVLIPHAEDAYEVYWNGKLIGSYGKLPPQPSWYYSAFPHTFALRGSANGVLAIRVWKAPLDIFSLAESGGLYAPPLVGDPGTISIHENEILWGVVVGSLFDYALILLRAFVAALCVVLWFRNRQEQLFVWVGVFTITPVALQILQNLFLIPIPYGIARAINQPIYALSNISLWFLLLWILRLNDRPRIVLLTIILAWITFMAGVADGLLALFWGSATPWMQWADGIFCTIILFLEVYPFFLIAIGLRTKLDESRWAVALAAFVLQLLHTIADVSALGQRFTHISLYGDVIDTPLFTIQGVSFRLEKVTSLALFAAIIYAVYRHMLEQQARRNALEQELQSAREIQQVLIPETLPSLERFAITSAYTPAQEVGGDFFQILPIADGSTIVALGDVSGKGLKAAMNVSMIVGVMRAQAATTSSPAEMLSALNHCLVGRMQGGFATGIIFRLDPDGTFTCANAGHLPPFLNGREFPLDPSLPLGLLSIAEYGETTLHLHSGDQLAVYTDGLLEARNETGELFGFERLHELFATRPTAQQASEVAVAFGQDDDITVLILTRLAAGEESTTSLVAPALESLAERI